MPGASLMMRFFGSPPRESRSASGPGTEADYQQGGGEDSGALRAARTSGSQDVRKLLAEEAKPLTYRNAMLQEKAADLIDHSRSLPDQARSHPVQCL